MNTPNTLVRLALNGNTSKYVQEGIGIGKSQIRTGHLKEAFRPMSDYRLLEVGFFNGARYVEDSHSRNVNTAWWALEETPGPIIWIAGGVDKGNDYSSLVDLVRKKVSCIIILGGGGDKIRDAFKGGAAHILPDCSSMDEAVMRAVSIANSGDTVLLAPACASFDLFENYEHRALEFRRCVATYACKSPTMW